MKETFDIIWPDLLKSEGSYVVDSGGPTNMGVTLSAWQTYVDRNATAQTIKNLTEAQAKDFYRAFYWNKVGGDLLPAGLDYEVFDFGVNAGQATAVKKLQSIVGTKADGVVGNQTLAAVANNSIPLLIDKFASARVAYYRSLKNFPLYGNGWLIRTERVRTKSQKLASGSNVPSTIPATPMFPIPEEVKKSFFKIVFDIIVLVVRRIFHV